MNKQKRALPELKLVGLIARTNNANEMNPNTSKIGALAGRYCSEQIADNIKHRANAGVTYSIYTEYESDEHGEYTYFIGELVDSFDDQDLSMFKTLTIPASDYQIFTTEPGKMPEVVISAWQAIWAMDESDFEANRKYIADFEIYDHRVADPNNAVIDIYIGIEG